MPRSSATNHPQRSPHGPDGPHGPAGPAAPAAGAPAAALAADPALLFQAVSDPMRLRLLRLLDRQELNVGELVGILGAAQSRVSKHLAVLRDAGWIRQRREGTWSWYAAVGPEAFPGGRALYEQVVAAARGLPSAAEDDGALARALLERDERSGRFFAGVGERWDEIRRGWDHPDLRLGALAALVEPGLSLLDLGTGTGALLPLLAGVAGRVCAVDRSEAMLARARALCRAGELTGVAFQRADAQALPFADAAFDAVYCAMVLHHVARPALAVAEIARVVRPGGKVVLVAFTRHNLTWMRTELAHQWLGFEREEIEAMLTRAGLRPRRYLVRRRLETADLVGGEAGGEAGGAHAWPDVFLAAAIKA